MIIRKANKEDKNRILEISSGIWDGEDYIPHMIDFWLSEPSGILAVAEIDGFVVGFAKLTELSQGEFWMEGIRADKSFSKKGIGAHLTQHLIEEAKNQGAKKLSLSTFVENYQSIHIIDEFGFKRQYSYKVLWAKPSQSYSLLPFQKLRDKKFLAPLRDAISQYNLSSLLHFDWSFLHVTDSLLEFLLERGDVYGYQGNFCILSSYKNKENGYSLSFVGNLKEECLKFGLSRAFQDNKPLIWMSENWSEDYSFVSKYQLSEGVEGPKPDVFFYSYPLK